MIYASNYNFLNGQIILSHTIVEAGAQLSGTVLLTVYKALPQSPAH